MLVSVLSVRGLELPRCFKLETTNLIRSSLVVAPAGVFGCVFLGAGVTFFAGAAASGLAAEVLELVPLGHLNCPFWLRTICIFSFRDILPKSAFIALQQATQFSSLLLPPFALATRCSTLASLFGSGFLGILTVKAFRKKADGDASQSVAQAKVIEAQAENQQIENMTKIADAWKQQTSALEERLKYKEEQHDVISKQITELSANVESLTKEVASWRILTQKMVQLITK